ncbi:hypothetical protein HUJ04_009565 [Dendroctonus ponderosae]|nr:hypothetical protein HUJ04_009565 [Dendroctonus ponderosae]
MYGCSGAAGTQTLHTSTLFSILSISLRRRLEIWLLSIHFSSSGGMVGFCLRAGSTSATCFGRFNIMSFINSSASTFTSLIRHKAIAFTKLRFVMNRRMLNSRLAPKASELSHIAGIVHVIQQRIHIIGQANT